LMRESFEKKVRGEEGRLHPIPNILPSD